MAKSRNLSKIVLLRLRRVPNYCSHQLSVFRRGRGCVKYSLFYRYMSVIIFLQSLAALCIALVMLWPSSKNELFDFQTSHRARATQKVNDVCGVGTHSLFFFWKGLQHYAILAQFLFAQSIMFLVTGVMMLLLSMGYSHFANLPREDFGHSSFRTRWLGYFCKIFPKLLKLSYILTFFFVFTPFFLVVINSTCERRVPEYANLIRIHNCRSWLFDCVKDKRFFGRQLECSRPTNYKAFPTHYCGLEENCLFPIVHSQMLVTVPHGICSGEDLNIDNLGPVPRCELCRNAREDSTTGVYVKGYDNMFKHQKRDSSAKTTQPKFAAISAPPVSLLQMGDYTLEDTAADRYDSQFNMFSFLETGNEIGIPQQSQQSNIQMSPRQMLKKLNTPPPQVEPMPLQQIESEQPDNTMTGSSLSAPVDSADVPFKSAEVSYLSPRSRVRRSNKDSEPPLITQRVLKLWKIMTVEDAFKESFIQTFFLMHQGSLAGRILYGWFFTSFCLFMVFRIIGVYLHRSIIEDSSFVRPPHGGKLRRSLHNLMQHIGL